MTKKIVLIAAVILIAGIFLMRNRLVTNPHQRELLRDLAQLDLNGMEPQVASKIQIVRQDVSNHPDSADAWGKLAMNLDAADLKKESIPVYQEAVTLNPSDFRWPYFCAMSLSEQGSDESLSWFERAQTIKPGYVPLIINYADALFQHGRTDQAAEKYQQAIQNDPKAAHAYFGLAQISFSRGDLQTARIMLQKAFGSDPSYGEAYNLLATVCRRLNDANCVEQASAAAKELPAKSHLSDPVYAQVGDEGESSLWHRARGTEYMKQRNYDAAIREFQEAIQIRSDIQTHEDLAQALSAAGKFPEAVDQYQSILREHATARNYFGLGLAYAKMGKYDQAEVFFRKAIVQKPDFAEAYFNLAVAYAKTGRLPETIENLQKAVSINPDYTEAHYRLALVYLKANDQKSALQECKIVMKLNPNAGKQLEALIEESNAE
jgi:tetratricopeptide (TPR) repeat protein